MTVLEASEIQKIIPHRYPMLLVDRIIELEPMKRAVGIKNAVSWPLPRRPDYARCFND